MSQQATVSPIQANGQGLKSLARQKDGFGMARFERSQNMTLGRICLEAASAGTAEQEM